MSRYQLGIALDRGAFLAKHLGRFENTTAFMARAMSAVVESIGNDQDLVRCLAARTTPDVESAAPTSACDPENRWKTARGVLGAASNRIALLTMSTMFPSKSSRGTPPERFGDSFSTTHCQGMVLSVMYNSRKTLFRS